METLYVGIDIAAKSATVAWQNPTTGAQSQMTITHSVTQYAHLVHELTRHERPEQTLVVMEATGIYWLGVADYLHCRGFQVSVINPLQAHRFAQLHLQRAKTDAIDAQLLASFARQMQPERWSPPPAIYHSLQQRLAYRADLLHMHTQERNRQHALLHHAQAEPAVLQRVQQHLAYLEDQIAALEAELQTLLRHSLAWGDAARRLMTIPGINLITAAWLLVATHGFARCATPEQAAAFAGLVPYPLDSGTSRHSQRRVGRSGHAALRACLYMVALSAARYTPAVKALYDRLRAQGKPHKVARVAAARKLLHIAWAVVVKERDYDPSFACQSDFVPTGS